MVRASNHALLARSSSTTASVSHSQRRREEVLMRSRRIKTVASDPSPNELGVNRCPLETRGKRAARSEERRVGKECRSRWARWIEKKKDDMWNGSRVGDKSS